MYPLLNVKMPELLIIDWTETKTAIIASWILSSLTWAHCDQASEQDGKFSKKRSPDLVSGMYMDLEN